MTHTLLNQLYLCKDKAASYNYVDFMKDPTPPNRSKQTHGTSCAGIISMKKNTGNCGTGVAYDSHIGGK